MSVMGGKCTVRGGAVIDKFGDAIMCCKYLPGDTWRARQDTGKLAIVSECIDALSTIVRSMACLRTSSLPVPRQLPRGRTWSGAEHARDSFRTSWPWETD